MGEHLPLGLLVVSAFSLFVGGFFGKEEGGSTEGCQREAGVPVGGAGDRFNLDFPSTQTCKRNGDFDSSFRCNG